MEWMLLVLIGALLAAFRIWWVPRFVKWLQDHESGGIKHGEDDEE